jgi:hypothetical protein
LDLQSEKQALDKVSSLRAMAGPILTYHLFGRRPEAELKPGRKRGIPSVARGSVQRALEPTRSVPA